MSRVDALAEVELRDALPAPGCAICRVGEQSATRYLRFVLHESVNDPTVRERLLAAWGFCRRHAWHFLRMETGTVRDRLATAILGEALVEALRLALGPGTPFGAAAPGPRELGRRHARIGAALAPRADCPACIRQRQHEAHVVAVLLKVLAGGGWRDLVVASDGLCVPHLRLALAEAEGCPTELEWLLADHRRRLQALLDDLQEYIRKHDYRFAGEAPGPEREAFSRATAVVAGTWFDLPAPGEPGP